MAELQAEIVIRLMSDGKVAAKWSQCGPLFLYGMLDMAHDLIAAEHARKSADSRIVQAAMPPEFNPRIHPDEIPPMMGNNGK